MVDNIKIVGKIGQFTQTRTDEPKLDMTIGLWHESIPSTSWQIGSYDELLNGPNDNGKGFKSYANDYINYVKNIIAIGKSKGMMPGEFYFHNGDPGPNNWDKSNLNNYKYCIPNLPSPNENEEPMINEFLIERLRQNGVKNFGLVVDMGKKKNPWSWTVDDKLKINENTKSLNGKPFNYANYNPTAEKVFILVKGLNNKLKIKYDNQQINKSERLYIQHLGFDNEGFGEVYMSGITSNNSCKEEPNKTIVSSVVINFLWDQYMNDTSVEWNTKGKYQWGITDKSPPLDNKCKYNSIPQIIPNTNREYAFIEFYNVPGDIDAVYMSDHPCYMPCSYPWHGNVKKFVESNYKDPSCDGDVDFGLINSYYGLNTPSRKNNIILERDINKLIDDNNNCTIYHQEKPTIIEIITGESNIKDIKYPLTTNYRDEIDLENMYTIMNKDNNLINIVESEDYKKNGKSSGINTRWMLSIENFSSSIGTIKENSLDKIKNDIYLSEDYIDKTNAESSIAIKYGGNGEPFELKNSMYNLSHITKTSGTFEAFGGWELDETMEFMKTINDKNNLVKNFMLYEFNFAKIKHCDPNYADERIN